MCFVGGWRVYPRGRFETSGSNRPQGGQVPSPFPEYVLVALPSPLRGAMATMNADLLYLLEKEGVEAPVIERLTAAGYTSLRLFAYAAETRAELRTFAQTDLEVDPAAGGPQRLAFARLLVAWDAAKLRVTTENTQQAESSASNLPQTLARTDSSAARRAFEAKWHKLDDEAVPAHSLFEVIEDQYAQGELRGLSLKEVISADDHDEDPVSLQFGKDGVVRLRRGVRESKLPETTEALRRRIRLMGVAYCFLRLRHPAAPRLATCEPHLWEVYADFLLGSEVSGLTARDADDRVVARPSLSDVISFDFQVRKAAFKKFNTGECMSTALRGAWLDPSIRSRFLVTPLAISGPLQASMSGARSKGASSSSQAPPPASGTSGKGQQGKGTKSKTGGKKKQRPTTRNTHTPDGRAICFMFNKPGGRCDGPCRFVHVCQRCFGNHPASACPLNENAPAAKKSKGDESGSRGGFQ